MADHTSRRVRPRLDTKVEGCDVCGRRVGGLHGTEDDSGVGIWVCGFCYDADYERERQEAEEQAWREYRAFHRDLNNKRRRKELNRVEEMIAMAEADSVAGPHGAQGIMIVWQAVSTELNRRIWYAGSRGVKVKVAKELWRSLGWRVVWDNRRDILLWGRSGAVGPSLLYADGEVFLRWLEGAVVEGVDEVAQSELRKRWAEGDKLVMRADAEATAAEMGGAGPSMQFLEE